MKKKIFSLIFILICGFISAKEKSIYTRGVELSKELSELAQSKDYILAFYSSGEDFWNEIKDNLQTSKVEKCYELIFDFNDLLKSFIGENPAVIENMKKRELTFNNLFATLFNESTVGVNAVVFSSIVTVSKVFDSKELKETKLYIYFFENSYPVYISFVKGEDNAVFACANYIFTNDFKDGIEAIKKQFLLWNLLNIKYKEVERK